MRVAGCSGGFSRLRDYLREVRSPAHSTGLENVVDAFTQDLGIVMSELGMS